jgi:hypothetical protein
MSRRALEIVARGLYIACRSWARVVAGRRQSAFSIARRFKSSVTSILLERIKLEV